MLKIKYHHLIKVSSFSIWWKVVFASFFKFEKRSLAIEFYKEGVKILFSISFSYSFNTKSLDLKIVDFNIPPPFKHP